MPTRCFDLHDRDRTGLQADLLLVADNPTTDITATHRIRGIWRTHLRFDRDAYRAQLQT